MAFKRQDTGPCPICGRALSKWTTHVTLKDENKVCRDCENRVRILYPLTYIKKKKAKYPSRKDPLKELNINEFREAMDRIPSYLEELRSKYGYNAVFEVDDITMQSHGWFSAPLIFAKGRVIYGFFDAEDKVRILRHGKEIQAQIKGVNREHSTEKDYEEWEHRAAGGYPLSGMVFSEKDLLIAPGDLIVK